MGRKPSITDKQREEASKRLSMGESYAQVSKALRIPKSTLVRNFSDRVPKLRELGTALATVEAEFEALPIVDQKAVRSIADRLKTIQEHYSTAAEDGAAGAAHLQRLARVKAQGLGDDASSDDIRTVAQLSETAKSMASLATNLITANKGKGSEPASTLESLITGEGA